MALSRIVELSVTRIRLVLPAAEFVRLPAAMGVTVVREGDEVRLTTEQPRCALLFHIELELHVLDALVLPLVGVAAILFHNVDDCYRQDA